MSYPYFAFIDESGTLAHDKEQVFFSIGLMLIEDTSRITQELSLIRERAIAELNAKASGFEFKFNRITKRSKDYYKRLIDTALSHPVKVCIFVLDKTDKNLDLEKHFKSTWDAYIGYAKFLIKNNVKEDNPCIVVMDYLCKPANHPKFIESELRSMPVVLNATMLESECANMIQLIDVMVGCVSYEFRRKHNPSIVINEAKSEIADYLKMKIGVKTLAAHFTASRPVYFNVWPFKANK